VITSSPGLRSLAIDIEIESTDMEVRRCTQDLIDCGATGCFIDIEWAWSNNVPTCPLTNPIPVYNVDGTANEASMIVKIADLILCYDSHSGCTQFTVTRLGKQSMILGYNWLHNYNLEIDWQTKDIKMSHCPKHCSTCHIETKHDAIAHKAKILQINACRARAFPSMIKELDDQDETTHGNANKTEEEVQGECPAFDNNLKFDTNNTKLRRVTMSLWRRFTQSILNILCVLQVQCLDIWPKPPQRTQCQRDSTKLSPQHSTPMEMCSAKQLSTLSLNIKNGTTPSN
jgi:hypothetical protein